MEKVIALCGPENSGKTTTLNMLIELLGVPDKTVKYANTDEDKMVFYENHQGEKTVIGTAGDDPKAIMIAIIFSIINDCDILIVAYSYSSKNNFPDKTIKDNITEILENLSEDNGNNETIDKWCKHYEDKKTDKATRDLLKEIIKSNVEGIEKIKEKAIELKASIENKDEEDFITYLEIGNKEEYKPINEIRIERIKSSINKKTCKEKLKGKIIEKKIKEIIRILSHSLMKLLELLRK